MQQKDKYWKILNSKYLIKEPWCTVRQDHVRLPIGVEIPNYYVLEYNNWTNVIAITKEHKYVLVSQYRHGLGILTYELPAGVCDDTDTSPIDSAKRELLEETGYGGGQWEELTIISANPGTHTNLCYCYLATDVEKISVQQLEETEDLEVVLFDINELKEILISDCMKQSMHTTPLWKYIALKGFMIE